MCASVVQRSCKVHVRLAAAPQQPYLRVSHNRRVNSNFIISFMITVNEWQAEDKQLEARHLQEVWFSNLSHRRSDCHRSNVP